MQHTTWMHCSTFLLENCGLVIISLELIRFIWRLSLRKASWQFSLSNASQCPRESLRKIMTLISIEFRGAVDGAEDCLKCAFQKNVNLNASLIWKNTLTTVYFLIQSGFMQMSSN